MKIETCIIGKIQEKQYFRLQRLMNRLCMRGKINHLKIHIDTTLQGVEDKYYILATSDDKAHQVVITEGTTIEGAVRRAIQQLSGGPDRMIIPHVIDWMDHRMTA